MSTVFYRWGAGRDESRVKFDGTHISVFDFKRQVMLDNNLGNGKDFDLVVLENGEEIKDDDHQIARSSSLVVRRRPASMKGRGNAQNYIIGTDAAVALTGEHRIEAHAREAMKDRMLNRGGARGAPGAYGSMSRRFDGKEEKKAEPAVTISTGDAEEDAKIRSFMQQQADTWEEMQEDMSTMPRFMGNNRRITKAPGTSGPGKFDFTVAPDKEPPVGYICYRCGQKGHWIQNCPTNDDPNAQDRKRFNRVTGIPRSFLKTVEAPATGEGSSGGAMLTADGGFVRAVADQRTWQKLASVKTRATTGGEDGDEAIDAELACPICKKVMREAVRVPCCHTAFCEECIQSYLLDHDFVCPSCESKVGSLDRLQPAEDLRERAKAYYDGQAEEGKSDEEGDGQEEGRGDGAGDVSGKDPFSGPMPDMNAMQEYLRAMLQTLRNPLVPPNIKAQLQSHIKMTNANLLQMQMLAAQGLIFGANMAQMSQMPQMMQMSAMGQMTDLTQMSNQAAMMGMNQGMNQGMTAPVMQAGGMQGGNGFTPTGNTNMMQGIQQGMGAGAQGGAGGGRGRGNFRGNFRGRGGAMGRGGGMGRAMGKRPAEDVAGRAEKIQRVA